MTETVSDGPGDAEPQPERAWLLMAVGENRQHGGNAGYDDEPSAEYRWDSTVPHHRDITVGDVVVLWDKRVSLGASVVTTITRGNGTKDVYRCPDCGRAGIKPRATMSPRFHCYKCGAVFEEPTVLSVEISTYVADYEAGWVDLSGLLDGTTLRRCAIDPGSQLSLRPLAWSRFAAEVADRDPRHSWGPLIAARGMTQPDGEVPGGHQRTVVRARIGQGEFRRRLLGRFGGECAFTGPAPLQTLEAAHLYRYATSGRHEAGGGLLLRRDIHALFDAGMIHVDVTEDPARIRIHPDLTTFPAYRALDNATVWAAIGAPERRWLSDHHDQSITAHTTR